MSRRETLPPRGERVGERRARAATILELLDEAYPGATCALTYESPWQLLVATILSAQCTDARVNQVTPALFRRFPDATATAGADIAELEALVQPTGFFRQKAKNVLATARRVVDVYDGSVPDDMTELLTLPGVARKTANVVLSNCFPDKAAGIAVDTHVQRITRRLGLTRSFPPEQVERDLTRIIPREHWNDVTHVLIVHGRAVCRATNPLCEACPISAVCPSYGRFTSPASSGKQGHQRRQLPGASRSATPRTRGL